MDTQGQLVIIGAGPAGIAAAITAIRDGFKPEQIILFEKGIRHDPSRTAGFGGAGANSDGKLVLESEVGGELASYVDVEMAELLDDVLELYLDFVPESEREELEQARGRFRNEQAEARIQRDCIRAGLQYIPADIIPLGTDLCHAVVDGWYEFLQQRGVQVLLETKVARFEPSEAGWRVICESGREFAAQWLLAAPGRSGHDFLVRSLEENGLATENGPIDIGVRVETDAQLTKPLTDVTWEFKLRGLMEGERVRTFCVCPEGSVLVEQYEGELLAVNGQTRPRNPTGRTNFAVLHTIHLDDPCDCPNEFAGLYIRTANILGARNPIVQTWSHFAARRRSRWRDVRKAFIKPTLERALPGDIRLALNAKSCRVIKQFMEALDSDGLLDGLCSDRTLLYAPEAKFYTIRPAHLSEHLESERENLFFAGDGSGITRGLVQASASGIVAGREIARRAVE